MPTTTDPERDRLQTIDELNSEVQEWRDSLLESLGSVATGVTDEAYKQRFLETVSRLLHIDGELHAADFAPEWVAEFRGLLLASIRSMQSKEPIDAYDDLLLYAEAIRHLLRDAIDAHVDGGQDNIGLILDQLRQWLPRVSQQELAGLFGISARQLQRWAQTKGAPTRRAQLVARLIALLRWGWTPEGVVAWFYRPRPELDGNAPIDVLDDVDYEQALITAVRQGRAQHGS